MNLQWHKIEQKVEKVQPKIHCCPCCGISPIKTDDRGKIQCQCSCFWCYLCPIEHEKYFKTPKECNKHIINDHKKDNDQQLQQKEQSIEKIEGDK